MRGELGELIPQNHVCSSSLRKLPILRNDSLAFGQLVAKPDNLLSLQEIACWIRLKGFGAGLRPKVKDRIEPKWLHQTPMSHIKSLGRRLAISIFTDRLPAIWVQDRICAIGGHVPCVV